MKKVINEFAIEFVQYLREKDVISISQKQINLLTDGKKIKSFSEHLDDFNNRNNNLIKKSRCCGRCDGVNDVCHADRICEKHTKIGCEICFGERW
jgi:hypothetical protein